MSNEATNPASCQTAVSGSGFIENPITIKEHEQNVRFQLSNVNGWMSVKDYESALIKARCLVDALENLMVLKLGLPK
jgi:hypothetical protein